MNYHKTCWTVIDKHPCLIVVPGRVERSTSLMNRKSTNYYYIRETGRNAHIVQILDCALIHAGNLPGSTAGFKLAWATLPLFPVAKNLTRETALKRRFQVLFEGNWRVTS